MITAQEDKQTSTLVTFVTASKRQVIRPGAGVAHRKRGSLYQVTALLKNMPAGTKDKELFAELKIGREGRRYKNVRAQVSTTAHSSTWVLYTNTTKMHFVRPLSEFTSDRFTLMKD